MFTECRILAAARLDPVVEIPLAHPLFPQPNLFTACSPLTIHKFITKKTLTEGRVCETLSRPASSLSQTPTLQPFPRELFYELCLYIIP